MGKFKEVFCGSPEIIFVNMNSGWIRPRTVEQFKLLFPERNLTKDEEKLRHQIYSKELIHYCIGNKSLCNPHSFYHSQMRGYLEPSELKDHELCSECMAISNNYRDSGIIVNRSKVDSSALFPVGEIINIEYGQ